MTVVITYFIGSKNNSPVNHEITNEPNEDVRIIENKDSNINETETFSKPLGNKIGYFFEGNSVVEETNNPETSKNDLWWLSSGGLFYIKDGFSSTIHGELSLDDKWRNAYQKSKPESTDEGKHPQNIFRLVSKKEYHSYEQLMYFRINNIVDSNSQERKESNGIFFFNRYQDDNNLYYAGLRVDGFAVIKKKIGGQYFTMDYKRVYDSNNAYNKDSNNCLIPKNKWIGLKVVVVDVINKVSIKLFVDNENDGEWKLVSEAEDYSNTYGAKPFFNSGNVGIRTDFLESDFRDFVINSL